MLHINMKPGALTLPSCNLLRIAGDELVRPIGTAEPAAKGQRLLLLCRFS